MTTPVSRRDFLHAAAATSIFAPSILAANKSGLGNPVLGAGGHTYECQHDWARPPAGMAFGNTHGVAVDSAGHVYIKHTVHASSSTDDAIAVFDPRGAFIRSFGADFKGGAHGLTLSREPDGEFLYLTDFARGLVRKTDLIGREVWTLTCPLDSGLYSDPAEYHPTNVAIVPSGPRAGEFFIADGYGKSWIHRYSPKAEYLGSFAGPGKERGQTLCPHGLMVDVRGPEPRLVVADRSNRRLQFFSLDGRHQKFTTDELRSPCHFDQRDGVLLIPDLEARVTLLDADDRLITHLGDGGDFALRAEPREKFVPGKFIAPHSACFDQDGNIFVVEWVEVGRVTRLRRL